MVQAVSVIASCQFHNSFDSKQAKKKSQSSTRAIALLFFLWQKYCGAWNLSRMPGCVGDVCMCVFGGGWGWMICNFTSFSTVFQSYQDDGQMVIKGCVQWNPVCS